MVDSKVCGCRFGVWSRVNAVPFLLDLASVSSNLTYRLAAIKLGHFTLQSQYSQTHLKKRDGKSGVGNASSWYRYGFAGGACDNPNVLDKEAGVLALQAFLALHAAAPGIGLNGRSAILPHS